MADKKRTKKPNDEQKEFLLSYMEEHLEFGSDKLESTDGTFLKFDKWQALADTLNSMEGARKDVNQWRKFWRDQKLQIKKRETLIRATFQISGVEGVNKMKKLSDFEKRLFALVVPELLQVPDGDEMFDFSHTSDSTDSSEDESKSVEIITPTDMVAAPSNVTTSYKRKREMSSFEEQMLKIEEEKLHYIKKSYDWKREYEGKLLELRKEEIALMEKELALKMKKN